MQSLVHPFTDVETAYRSERISASFRDHAAGRHRFVLRRHRHFASGTTTTSSPHRSLRAA